MNHLDPITVDHDVADHVRRCLVDYMAQRRAECAVQHSDIAAAVDSLIAFTLGGGKRVRPTFAWWGWRAAGGQENATTVLPVVSALELLQSAALTHDDLIDDSATRRGHPTVHVDFAERHRESGWHGSAERFGAAAAVLLGDFALTWAEDMLHTAGLTAAQLTEALTPWRAMRCEVLGGQYLDVLVQARGDETTEAALRIAQLKSASYTVERPLHLGAALAGASADVVDTLRRFGADIGVAFQLRDDLLGVFGDPQVTGKPAGDDLREGKRTLLIAVALEHAEQRGLADQAKLLRAALGDPELTDDRVSACRAVLTELGAVDAVERRISDLTESALATLDRSLLARPAVDKLTELAIITTRRDH